MKLPRQKKSSEKQDHVDWLVKHRAENQRTSAKLYRLLRENPRQLKRKAVGSHAQILISIAFSLWRSAFLSDKTGKFKDTVAGAELFLEEMLMNNAIAYSQDRKSKDWTFNYYATNAWHRIQDYYAKYPALKRDTMTMSPPKARWEQLQQVFGKLVDHFEGVLKG